LDEWRVNNFDLIRLFAALQVAIVHCAVDLHLRGPIVDVVHSVLRLFPGVPIFFVVSGFLVSRSFERSTSLREFYRNRCLRIYPGLWVCLVASLVVILVWGIGALEAVSAPRFFLWWAGQMSGFWMEAPQFLAHVGTGRLNPSLWTIPVELQFYLLLPLLYYAIFDRARARTPLLLAVLAGSVALHAWIYFPGLFAPLRPYPRTLGTAAPYLWMFLIGVLAQRNWPLLRRWLVGRAPVWLLAYLAASALVRWIGVPGRAADMTPLLLIPLAGLVLSCAMSMRTLADRLLHRHDISYGIYIYHMLALNVAIQYGARGSLVSAGVVIGVSLMLGALSWHFVERPFLARKRHALRALSASDRDQIGIERLDDPSRPTV
jgi:peptidoglycan/LPS O-acetylase OafA/YrhL